MKIQSHSLLAAVAAICLTVAASAQTALETAGAALKFGDLAAADAALAPLATGEKPDPAALNLLSQVRMAQKNTKDAIALAEKAAQLAPDNADYHAQLGIALSARMPELAFMQQAMIAGKMRKAFERAVALDPKNANALVGLARYFANAPEIAGGSLIKAAEFAARLKELDPFLGESELGRIAERGEKLSEALAHYEAAAQTKPDAGAQFNYGRVLAKLGKTDEARTRFEATLKLNPNFEAARKALAELAAPAAAH
ncbi:MAG: tetratricopeptide repeat protein [Opitutae bacterium]|nr:tetratricopeptide repeat protein [Opitutae bacterium]